MFLDYAQVQQAAKRLRDGDVLAYPTEAVWGLGCDPSNESAIKRLLALKKRPPEKGLILIGASTDHFAPLLNKLSLPDRDKVVSTWPGPVTWVLPHFGLVSPLISGGRDTVAIRVTGHVLAAKLCEVFGGCIVSTSANPTGFEPAKSREVVAQYFGEDFPVVDGELGGLDRPTKIYTLTGATLRS